MYCRHRPHANTSYVYVFLHFFVVAGVKLENLSRPLFAWHARSSFSTIELVFGALWSGAWPLLVRDVDNMMSGAHISPALYAWLAVLVLPVNSALNPVLYTLTTAAFKQQVG